MADPSDKLIEEVRWFVAHTRPRCEKKLVQYTTREGFDSTLPCVRTVHRYRGKTVSFDKPLFPSYVFLRLRSYERSKVYQSDYVANLLSVPDQEAFEVQLKDILRAVDEKLEILLAPEIGEGSHVRVKHGALQGMDGWVEKRYGLTTILLRLDFIGQAAAVKMEADELEPI